MGLFSRFHSCPEIGKTIECVSFDVEEMEKGMVGGENVKLNIRKDYIEIHDSKGIERIQWQFERKEGTNYYYLGTEDLHQWIIGRHNITHIRLDEVKAYIRTDNRSVSH